MVIPIPNGGAGMMGEPPEAVRNEMNFIKYTVFVVGIASIGKACLGLLPLNEWIYCMCGVFLLREDPMTGGCYRCLMNSPLGQCAQNGGGLSCLSPVLFIGALNILFGLRCNIELGFRFYCTEQIYKLLAAVWNVKRRWTKSLNRTLL